MSGAAIIARADNTDINGVADLAGKTVTTQNNSTAPTALQDQVPPATLQPYTNDLDHHVDRGGQLSRRHDHRDDCRRDADRSGRPTCGRSGWSTSSSSGTSRCPACCFWWSSPLPDVGVLFSLDSSAVIAMAMFSGAFVCESIRTGINTVQLGQAEATRSIGLTFAQSMRYVILPQALRPMVRPLVKVWIGTLIGSLLASVIGIQDDTAVGQKLNNRYPGGVAVFASVAATVRDLR